MSDQDYENTIAKLDECIAKLEAELSYAWETCQKAVERGMKLEAREEVQRTLTAEYKRTAFELEAQLAEWRGAAQAVLTYLELTGGDFNDAINDLAALLEKQR